MERFHEMLAVGGKTNSLGRANEVIAFVVDDKTRLDELYDCLFNDDPWIRMRAADALEKVCRVHPDWLLPYVDKIADELLTSDQASIQWHLAQIYTRVDLTDLQRQTVMNWLASLLSVKEVDWIVAANVMDTLAQFTREGHFPVSYLIRLLEVQRFHKSKAVVKRSDKLLTELTIS